MCSIIVVATTLPWRPCWKDLVLISMKKELVACGCAPGYEGPLCMGCSETHFAAGSSCFECSGGRLPPWLFTAGLVVTLMALSVAGVVATAYFVYSWHPGKWVEDLLGPYRQVVFAKGILGTLQEKIVTCVEKPDRTTFELEVDAVSAHFKKESEKVRHHMITEMLLEHSILEEVGRNDRILQGAKETLFKYATFRDLWMEVVLKLVAVALVRVVSTAQVAQAANSSDEEPWPWCVLAITLTMAGTVWMVHPYAQPQVNDLQFCCFLGLSISAVGFSFQMAWLSRLGLLAPLLLAAGQAVGLRFVVGVVRSLFPLDSFGEVFWWPHDLGGQDVFDQKKVVLLGEAICPPLSTLGPRFRAHRLPLYQRNRQSPIGTMAFETFQKSLDQYVEGLRESFGLERLAELEAKNMAKEKRQEDLYALECDLMNAFPESFAKLMAERPPPPPPKPPGQKMRPRPPGQGQRPVAIPTGAAGEFQDLPGAAAAGVVGAAAAFAAVPGRRKGGLSRRPGRSLIALKATDVIEKPKQEVKGDLEKENEELIATLAEQVEAINELEEEFEKMGNDQLRAKTDELRKRIQAKGFEKKTVNEAFAVLREAVWRVLELWYFDVQLLGGLVLHKERLAEMKTGEGKTIVALLPTFLAALEDKGGVFVVTPNDYLARRDAENVGQVLRFLGLTVGLVQSTMEVADRQKAYKCDVVYLTNAELGFDYLRDNLAVYPHQVVQSKSFHFCLVDEADSILIDEARTPLIISESVPAVPRQFEAGREAAEFEEIYGLRCTGVPTARPNVRRDYPDVVYKTEEAKLNAIVEEIVLNNERNGRPILIGTANVKMSEAIVSRLREAGVEPQLLNARPESIARENETISQAGRLGMVTVSTNMAGRGTDIILGGNHSQMAALNIRSRLADALLSMEESAKVYNPGEEFYPTDIPGSLEKSLTEAVEAVAKCPAGEATQSFLEVEELVASVGGEAPFEANESAQALTALRKAFAELKTLYKDLMRMRSSRRAASMSWAPHATSLVALTTSCAVEQVDRGIREPPTRTTLFEFDKVISKQRELTYKTRKEFLANEDKAEWGEDAVDFHIDQVKDKSDEEKAKEFEEYFGRTAYHLLAGCLRRALLQKMDALKQTVGLAAYKGTEPLKEYQVQGFKMYQKVENKYKARSVSRWLRSKPKKDAKQ
eukprot:g14044.t1